MRKIHSKVKIRVLSDSEVAVCSVNDVSDFGIQSTQIVWQNNSNTQHFSFTKYQFLMPI